MPMHHNYTSHPTKAGHQANFGLMLGQRRRRWPNIKPRLGLVRISDSIRAIDGIDVFV